MAQMTRVYGGVPDPFEWTEYYNYSFSVNSIATNNGMTYIPNEIKLDQDRDFIFMKTMHFIGGGPYDIDVMVRYRDEKEYWMKRGVLLRTIAGRSIPIDNSGSRDFRPFVWPAKKRLGANISFIVETASVSSLYTPNLYITFHGAKVNKGIAPWKMPGIQKTPYIYPLTPNLSTLPDGVVLLTANQMQSFPVVIDKSSNFLCQAIVGSADGEALINITEGGRDKAWMNTAAHFWNVVGDGAFPHILPAPKLSPGGSTINVTLQDLSGSANHIFLAFVGQKLTGG